MIRKVFAVSLIVCLGLTACSPKGEQARETLEKPINCETAAQDIKILEEERKSVGEQVAQGVTNIVPVGAVIKLLKGEWVDGAEVAVGKYNRELKERSAEITKECGVA